MTYELDDYVRMNQNLYLDKSDLGKLISVIIENRYYNKPEVYENCLLVKLLFKDNLRPKEMTLFYEGQLKKIKIDRLNTFLVKFIN